MTRLDAGRLRPLALALALLPAVVGAQGNASAAASAMGGNYTALARNFNATAWNPANLGLPGNSSFSLALISPQLGIGTGPVTFSDLKTYEGIVVPAAVREQWLQKIVEHGGQAIGGDADFTPLAFSIGSLAFSATTTVRTNGSLPEAFAELIFFGNAGRLGTAQDYSLSGLALDANATTTFAASYGRRFGIVPVGDFSLGVTAKYIVGHGMASMRDNGSTITSNPLSVVFETPVVLTDTSGFRNGSGVGLDVGAAWQIGNLRAAAVLRNIVNTFAWNTDRLYYIPVSGTFNQDTSMVQGDSILPIAAAPPALRDALTAQVQNSVVKPTLALGVAWTGLSRLTVTGDIRQRFGTGLELGPQTQIGVGAEVRLIPFVPLRAGVTSLGGGMRLSGGFGFEFGVFNLQTSLSRMSGSGRDDTAVGFTMSFGGR